MRTRTLALIVVGAVVVLSGVTILVVSGSQLLASTLTNATTGPPLVEGQPGDPVAVEPMACEEQCFTDSSIRGAIPPHAEFRYLGLPVQVDSFGDFESTSAELDYGATAVEWRRADFEPDECFFTYYSTPLAAPLGEDPVPNEVDVIEFTGTHSNDEESSYLWQSVRLFDSSRSAEEHMRSLDDQTPLCDGFSSRDTQPTRVTPAPALELPDSVAAIGWVESSILTRYYVFDVQRGNLVVRSILSTYVNEISEQEFRAFVEMVAADLAAVEIPAT